MHQGVSLVREKAWLREIGLLRSGSGRGPGLTAFSAGCQGIRRISPITRAEEFYYPPWKRLLFQLLVSLPLCLACLVSVFVLMLGCFQLQVTAHPYSFPAHWTPGPASPC